MYDEIILDKNNNKILVTKSTSKNLTKEDKKQILKIVNKMRNKLNKKKINSCVLLIIGLFIFNFPHVYASSGALKQDSIKQCPDGLYYGYHSKDNHWHQAEASYVSSGWTAIGEPLNGDPCPSENTTPVVPAEPSDSTENVPKNDENVTNNEITTTPPTESIPSQSNNNSTNISENNIQSKNNAPTQNENRTNQAENDNKQISENNLEETDDNSLNEETTEDTNNSNINVQENIEVTKQNNENIDNNGDLFTGLVTLGLLGGGGKALLSKFKK